MSRIEVVPLPRIDRTGGRTIITAPWGDGREHKGTDLGTSDGIEIGTPVYAPVDGKIVHYQYDGPFRPPNRHTAGHNIWFQADNGDRWKMFHLAGPPVVPVGTWVKAGTHIAAVGNSGTQAAHLHLEKHRGNWSNPVDGTADVAEAINAGRWAGSLASAEDADPDGPNQEDPMPDPFVFPESEGADSGATYVLTPTPFGGTGFAWVHIGEWQALLDAHSAHTISNNFRPLAAGNDADDALWERHPVLSGPHKRETHTR